MATDNTNNDIVITLPNDADYTDIITELVYWFQHGDCKQIDTLGISLRAVTDSLACVMPNPLE